MLAATEPFCSCKTSLDRPLFIHIPPISMRNAGVPVEVNLPQVHVEFSQQAALRNIKKDIVDFYKSFILKASYLHWPAEEHCWLSILMT